MSPKKPTLKQRVAEAEAANPSHEAASSSCEAPGRKPPQNANVPYASTLKRRLGIDTKGSSSTGQEGSMYTLLREKWAKGDISSVEVQEFAAASGEDGDDRLSKLRKLGASGRQSGNANRDLARALGKPKGSPEFFFAHIPVAGHDGQPKIVSHPFVLPHELFSQLFQERHDTFLQCVAGDSEERGQVWGALASSPVVQRHPCLAVGDLSHTVPIGLHGDAGAFSNQDSLFVLTWNSLVGQGTTRELRFMATCIRKSDLLPDGSTLEAVFHVLAWSLNSLLEGLTPHSDPDGLPLDGGGSPLAGPWKGACIQVRGDWQFYCQAFNFPAWNTNERMCWLCQASNVNSELLWTDFNTGAGWRGSVWSHEGYVADVEGRGEELPNIFSIRGLRLECILVDVLHAVDLGVASLVVGNVLNEVLPGLGPNREKQMATLNARLASWYKANKITSQVRGKLTWDKIRATGNFPEFKAKAAATRHIVPFAAALAAEFDSGSEHDRRRRVVVESLLSFYAMVQAGARHISANDLRRLPECCQALCTNYAHLSLEAVRANVPAWQLKPKLHLFQHLCHYQVQQFGNPRFYWTYPDEDMVGQMVEVAKSCHPSTLAKTALYKWLVMAFKD
jgi:hypothetical protein